MSASEQETSFLIRSTFWMRARRFRRLSVLSERLICADTTLLELKAGHALVRYDFFDERWIVN
jgi:hypothetical protein